MVLWKKYSDMILENALSMSERKKSKNTVNTTTIALEAFHKAAFEVHFFRKNTLDPTLKPNAAPIFIDF